MTVPQGVAVKAEELGDRPLLFLDIDGVINRLPFREILDSSDPLGSRIERTEKGADLFDDVPETPEEGLNIHPLWSFKTWISEELASIIRSMETSGEVKIVFLSMWDSSTGFLNYHLGTEIPHVKLVRKGEQIHRDDPLQSFIEFREKNPQYPIPYENGTKYTSIMRLFSAMAEQGKAIPAFGWVDDVVTAPAKNGDSFENVLAAIFEAFELELPPTKIINTDTTEGLRRSHIEELSEFFEANGAKLLEK